MPRFPPVPALICLVFLSEVSVSYAAEPWQRHSIDRSSRGADGVRLQDVNGDGFRDIATGWEEGGVIRAYLNPGPKHATEPWPQVTVGKVRSPEDAVFADLDGDGFVDVVSSCEGKTRTMFFHWAPSGHEQFLNADAWKTEALPCTEKKQSWMFALPMDIDGRHGIDLIVSSKGGGAAIGWLESPENPRDVSAWKYHRLRDAGWIMSLVAYDMDDDGDLDVVASDRKGSRRGVLWLENPGAEVAGLGKAWPEHSVGGEERENMFLDVLTNAAGQKVILSAVKPAGFIRFLRDAQANRWTSRAVELPSEKLGTGKSIRVADLNLDGQDDLIYSCEQASGALHGVIWMEQTPDGLKRHPLSGPEGVKYDLLQLEDLDADGDLDVLCCEERTNLGVFWYENPTK